MSFCIDVKNELAEIRPSKRSKLPLVYGFLLFGRSFSYKRISMQSSNSVMTQYYKMLMASEFGVNVELEQGGGTRPTFRASVTSEADRLKILASLDHGMCEGAINHDLLYDHTAVACFVRGAFLACGNLSDPEKEYRADFSVRDPVLANEFKQLLEENYISANISKRGTGYVVYIRRSEMITNLLTLMGLSDRSLQLIETTIVKSVKNNINRARNCDNANISKTVEASIKQRKAIEFLEKTGRLEVLPEQLFSAARLRMENPEASLNELCKLSNEPITVSGLNHRLQRIIEIYEELQ